ncbi:MAG TPA: tetratricopeptide repeat protein, partial [Thermoanaerobaculia bacterium]
WIGGAVAGLVLIAIGVATTVRQQQPSAPVQHGPLSLAILPFRDLNGTADGQIFADGIAEMLRAQLGESPTIRVIPAFDRGATADPPSVARRLGAAFALTGAVQRSGNVVHLSISVIDAASGVQVAGETLNGSSNDVFGLQNRAVNFVLSGVNVQRDPRQHSSVVELSNPADQNAYVEALGLLQRAQDEKSVDRAITILQRLLLNARDSAAVNAQLARALLYKAQMSRRPGLIAQATVYAERAVDLDDASPEVHVRLGFVRAAAGRYAEAEREFRRVLTLRNDNADAYLGLALSYEAMGRAADAEVMYKKAIALRRDHPNSYNLYAAFLFNAGRPGEAAANFLRFTQLMPTARGFNNLGGAYQAMGRYDDAQRAYERSIALEPNSDAYGNLGIIDYYMGRYDEACRALEKATSLAPGSYLAWVALGDAYRWSPDSRTRSKEAYESGINAARAAVAANPRDALARANEAIALAKLGRASEATSASNSALKLDPNNQTVLYAAGVVNLLRGNPDVAVGWLQRAVSAGYPISDLQRDPELKSIQADPAFPRQVVHRT